MGHAPFFGGVIPYFLAKEKRRFNVIDIPHPELIATACSLFFGFVGWFWVKVGKPLVKLLKSQDYFKESVEEIRKELQTNGGSSLKDAIIDMKDTVNRIDERQKVIEQRTKAALHYSNEALFETDHNGRMIWNNANFCEVLPEKSVNLEGYDWLTIIHEDEREEVLQEFISCLDMNRRFLKTAEDTKNNTIRLLGYPYRIDDEHHGGFLVSVSKTNEV
jgi:PAS domain S-box-containing protein